MVESQVKLADLEVRAPHRAWRVQRIDDAQVLHTPWQERRVHVPEDEEIRFTRTLQTFDPVADPRLSGCQLAEGSSRRRRSQLTTT